MQSSDTDERSLTEAEVDLLRGQDSRLVPNFKADKFQKEAQKHWDIFYKRNTTKFFKDRHWTTREFQELSDLMPNSSSKSDSDVVVKRIFEVGCGVGNFIFPLLEELRIFAFVCDFSPRAVEMVRTNPMYDETRIKAFQCDITSDDIENLNLNLNREKMDIVSMVFVLSAIKPDLFPKVFENLREILEIGGKLIFRDYAVNDMAMLRFKSGTKISDRLYLRQDGTTSYFFSMFELKQLAEQSGFKVNSGEYIHRKTVNKKENVDVPRIFLQAVLEKI